MKKFIKNEKVCTIISKKLSSKILTMIIMILTLTSLISAIELTDEQIKEAIEKYNDDELSSEEAMYVEMFILNQTNEKGDGFIEIINGSEYYIDYLTNEKTKIMTSEEANEKSELEEKNNLNKEDSEFKEEINSLKLEIEELKTNNSNDNYFIYLFGLTFINLIIILFLLFKKK